MKVEFTSFLLASSTLVSAIAVANPAPEAKLRKHRGGYIGWCGVEGSPCSKTKRDALPEAEAKLRKAAGGYVGWCGVEGSPCSRMKRSADAIAEAFASAEPKLRKAAGGYVGWCGVEGSPCSQAKRDLLDIGEMVERSVSELNTRSAEAEASLRKAAGGYVGWCGVEGSPCSKVKRDAEADAKLRKARGGYIGWCGVEGSPCSKVKRDAEADAKLRKARGGYIGWCGVEGSPCSRDLDGLAAQNIVRSIEEYDPTALVGECKEEGNECAALLKAHKAFHAIKRDAEAIEHDYEARAAQTDDEVAGELAEAVAAGDEKAKRDAQACYEEGGACVNMQRDLQNIERSLNEAVAAYL